MNHEETRWRSDDTLGLYGRHWWPETSPRGVVCIVHGLGEHSGRYARMAAFLCDAGFAVTAMDLRGHGRSDGVRGHARSYDHMLGDIATLIEQSARRWPDLPRFLYGHSMGGALVLNVVLKHRPDVAGVVASSPALRPTHSPPRWKTLVAGMLVHACPSLPFPSGVHPDHLSRTPSVVRDIREDPLVFWAVSARLGLDLLAAGRHALLSANRIAVPLLLMHGTADKVTSPDATAEFATQAGGLSELKLWDGLFHVLHEEPESGDVMAHMVHWLRRHL